MQLTVSVIDSPRKTAQPGRITSHYEFATHTCACSYRTWRSIVNCTPLVDQTTLFTDAPKSSISCRSLYAPSRAAVWTITPGASTSVSGFVCLRKCRWIPNELTERAEHGRFELRGRQAGTVRRRERALLEKRSADVIQVALLSLTRSGWRHSFAVSVIQDPGKEGRADRINASRRTAHLGVRSACARCQSASSRMASCCPGCSSWR